jgi:1,4-dihydroxy-2-naphthoyl-CoA hydrolase
VAMYDDEWYEQWKQRMEESGGNIILALGLRPIEENDDRVVMEMPMSGNVRQGTGVFAAGALMQLADVAATIVCSRAAGSTPEDPKPFPLSVQISVNLLRNTNKGKATAESRIVHRGRTMTVVESKVHDDDGRLLCIVTSTHVAPGG